MKASDLNDSLNSTQLEFLQENTTKIPILCPGNNDIFQLCLDESCKSSPVFTCGLQKCECHKNHQLCMKGNLSTALEIIRSKLENTDDLKLYIENTFDRIVDQLSVQRDDMIQLVEQKMKYVMLHDVEEKLLKISQKRAKTTSISTSETAFLWKIFRGKNESKTNIFDVVKTKINELEQHIRQNAQKTKQKLCEEIKSFKTFELGLIGLDFKEFKQSQVLSTSQSRVRLIRMFQRRVKSLKLLYRASKNNFNLQKYYDACGTVTDTIIIVLTNKDKIFGGYTPLCLWNGETDWVADPQKKSFLFSISQDQKFKLTNASYALYRLSCKTQFIQFGSDFIIWNNANTNTSCLVGHQSYYNSNPKYKIDDKESYLKLNGNQTPSCTFKDWEVYKVQFEE